MTTLVPYVDCFCNVMAHAQKPYLVFLRNGRVHLNRRGRQFSRLLADDVCASAVVMSVTPGSEVVWRVLATHSIPQFPLPCFTVYHHVSNGLYLEPVPWERQKERQQLNYWTRVSKYSRYISICDRAVARRKYRHGQKSCMSSIGTFGCWSLHIAAEFLIRVNFARRSHSYL